MTNKWSRDSQTSTCKGMKLDTPLILHTKLTQIIINLNVRAKTTELVEEITDLNICDI